jgi:hypothetical protein
MTGPQYAAYREWSHDTATGAGHIYGPALRESTQMNLVGQGDATSDYNRIH